MLIGFRLFLHDHRRPIDRPTNAAHALHRNEIIADYTCVISIWCLSIVFDVSISSQTRCASFVIYRQSPL